MNRDRDDKDGCGCRLVRWGTPLGNSGCGQSSATKNTKILR